VSPRPRPSGWLLRQIPGVVSSVPGFGCSKADLAAALNVEPGPVFEVSVMVCYRRGEVDFCWGYVVAPASKDDDGPSRDAHRAVSGHQPRPPEPATEDT
jgi:hypothetical protein